jgi:hypothetical protein
MSGQAPKLEWTVTEVTSGDYSIGHDGVGCWELHFRGDRVCASVHMNDCYKAAQAHADSLRADKMAEFTRKAM